MWRRTYLFLVLVRLWFALSPSYLHPDENFQGPEVIAGMSTTYSLHWTAFGLRAWFAPPFGLAVARVGRFLNLRPGHRPGGSGSLHAIVILAGRMLTLLPHRGDLQLPSPAHLGIYERQPDTKRLSAMASLRAADAPAAVALDRKRE